MKRLILSSVLSVLLGLPLGWIISMALTPVLWRLEPILHLELAGHSGPSDWVFYLVWAFVLPSLFLFFRVVVFPNRAQVR